MSVFRDNGAQVALLPDGKRLHLQHGPIDLVIQADGDPREVTLAYRQAAACFETLLGKLVEDLPLLRTPIAMLTVEPSGPVARRMIQAVQPHAGHFITPMAAVAGAVADEVLAALCRQRYLARAFVNNGGDIALHLAPGEICRVGIVADPRDGSLVGTVEIETGDRIYGLATSGRHGRSHSLGIADSVTVLAVNAAAADAAATLIANAVDLPGSPAVSRVPASALAPDSDLGARLVTVGVSPLRLADKEQALARGVALAERLRVAGVIAAAYLSLQGESRVVSDPGESGYGLGLPLRRKDTTRMRAYA